MGNLIETELFRQVKDRINSFVAQILDADNVAIFATADLDSIVSLAFLESAMIDAKIPYSRKILKSVLDQPKGEQYDFSSKSQLVISIEQFEDTWNHEQIDDVDRIRIVPLSVSVSHPNSDKQHNGALDVVIQCAALASILAPNGPRVRRLRPLAGSGQWLRQSLDNSYDPVYTKIRDVLQDEGSIRVVSLPEITNPDTEMIPNFPSSLLKRLAKKWPKMNFEQRKQAMSELALPTLMDGKISTPRLEELFWFRIVIDEDESDLHSQIYQAKSVWPGEEDASKSHAASILKGLISTGKLV